MATTVAGTVNYLESDGKAVNVDLQYTVAKDALGVVEGWVGVFGGDGVSGDTVALVVDNKERQWKVPASLSVAKGATVFITIATITGHYPDDEAYTTSAGAGKVALFKATAAKDGNNFVTGIMLANAALAS